MKVSAVVLSFVWLAGVPAWAVLGQPVQSVQADRAHLKGQLRSVAQLGYSVHHISAPDGTEVREFASPEGMVFGVAWQGPAHPDLRQLLGANFEAFQQAARASRHRRGPLVVHVGSLVVEMGGHMRAYRGRAYLVDLVPKNLSQAVVR